MTKTRVLPSLGIALALSLSASADPLRGSLPNRNPDYGGASYNFEEHAKSVFVFHHFGVEVC